MMYDAGDGVPRNQKEAFDRQVATAQARRKARIAYEAKASGCDTCRREGRQPCYRPGPPPNSPQR